MAHPRKHTNKLLDLVYDGMLDGDDILLMALNALSDAEVHEMCQRNDIFLFEEEEDDDEESY